MEVSGQPHELATLHLGENPVTQWTHGCMGPRACLALLEKRKVPVPSQNMNHKTSSLQFIHNTDWAIPAPKITVVEQAN